MGCHGGGHVLEALSVYLGLGALAFGAATLLPLQSEAALAGLLLSERCATALLLFAATLGNVAGSTLNGWLGLHLERFRQRRWFPVSPERLPCIQAAYQLNAMAGGRCCSVGPR